MLRAQSLSILIAVASIYQADSIELLANYKLWKAVSPQLVHEFSGSSRHGRMYDDFSVTDRGLAPCNAYTLRLMVYGFISLDEYTISFWMLNSGQYSKINLSVYYDSGNYFRIRYIFDSTINYTKLEFLRNTELLLNPSINPKIEGWNLHTMRVYKNSSDSSILNMELYLDLNPLYFTFIDSGLASFKIANMQIYTDDVYTQNGIILNEVWVHGGFSNIIDLSVLVSGSVGCVCEYKCPTTTTQSCLNLHGEAYNKAGQLCDTLCTNNSQSCNSIPSDCILKNKVECQYGLYDRESLECIFYCPNNSCVCPTIASSPVNTLLSCDCITGYNKIPNDPESCISNRCLEYHKSGYIYVCDSTESGYSLSATGECCICSSGFTQIQPGPLICVNTSICIGYSISAGDYICSSCAEGYTVDDKGKCNLCSSGYENVLLNPYTCILEIENCINYIYINTVWVCETCREGYLLFEISINHFICAKIINSCVDYKLVGMNPLCSTCQDGFHLSESKGECRLLHCLAYIVEVNNYYCSECSKGYEIDSDGKCNKCSDNYERVSEDPFTCIPKIEYCTSYQESDSGYICQECILGYKVGSTGLCDQCQDGFVLIESESAVCKYGIPKCLYYEMDREFLMCMICEEGYRVDLNYECNTCDNKYVNHPKDSSVCIREISYCLVYELLNDMIVCIECESGYDLDDNLECKSCAQGYTYSDNAFPECTLKPDDTNQDSDSNDSDSTNSNEEEILSEVQIQRGEAVESTNAATATTAVASTGVSSMLSMDPNTLILYLNTIQAISLIQYLNVDLPFEIRQQQKSTSKHIKKMNIFSYIRIQDKDLAVTLKSYLNDENSFLAEIIYQFMSLACILIINFLVYCISRCTKGKLKELGSKCLRYFKYNIYIQLYMITYLNTTYSALSKLLHVMSI